MNYDFTSENIISNHMNVTDKNRSLSILYIEDNLQNQRLVNSIIHKRTNHILHLADTAQEGIDAAFSLKPDLILLDINLPDISGYDVLITLKADTITKNIPVIAITANATSTDFERAKKEDFFNYITKPFNITEFIDSINAAVSE